MDEMENQDLPREPENMEAPPVDETAAENVTEEGAAQDAPAEEAPAEEAPAEPAPREVRQEPQPVQPPRRRSPYENSPYVMGHQPAAQARPVEPAEAGPVSETERERPKKPGKGRIFVCTLALILGLTAFGYGIGSIAVGVVEDQMNLRLQALEERIGVLQEELDARDDVPAGDSVSGTPNTSAGGMTPAQVYAMNQQAVVLIETDVATGSGFVLTEDGYVVTNYHVVEDGRTIHVVLHDWSSYEARLVGYDANNDVALLKMEGEGFRPVTLGSSDALIVGDRVAAIGNPLGELTSTLTVGYVSAKERDVSTDSAVINMIQTDCAINSGNSGGPLFNMKGEVVGITTAKYSGMSASGASIEGIGFAVPMDDVVGILEDLMEFGYVKSGYLGVGVYSLYPGETAVLGCLVDSVTPGSCADIAGVRPGDIIIGLGGYVIEGYTDLSRTLREFEGGEETTITVYRNGQELVLAITLDAKPQETPAPSGDKPMPENGSYEEWYNYFFGE